MKTTNKYTIANYLCNSDGYLKMKYLIDIMSETALNQANIADKGILPESYRWIVLKWDIEIDEPLKYKDEVEVTTFAIKMKRFYAYRNFEIKKNGKTVVRVYCEFLIMDIEKLRLVSLPKELEASYGIEEAIYWGKESSYKDNFDTDKLIALRQNDVDINGHINNAAYMDLVKEITGIKDQDISFVNIFYKNEIRNKDYVLGKKIAYSKETDFEIKSLNDDKVYAYGKLETR